MTVLSTSSRISLRMGAPTRARFNAAFLALLAALAWPCPGWAGEKAPAAPRTNPAAEARYEAGVTAYEQGRYRDAVERFKEADELAPSPLLSFNIAKVYERMADDRNALAAYRTYLRRLPEAENRAAVLERIGALERALQADGVQQLTVISNPAGATVSIDNVNRGVTPWTGELIPGPHSLIVRLDGHRESVSEIDLPADHAIDIQTSLVPGADAPVTAPEPTEIESPPIGTPAPPEPLAPAAELGPSAPRWWTWAMFGGSAAAFVGAGAFELSRGRLEDEARDEEVQIVYGQKVEAMEDRQAVARVFFGVGIVAAIAGGVSLYFDVRNADAGPGPVAFDCGPAGCALTAGGRF
jgi:tetratricopeptide (TPR) repeat protein